MKWNARSRCAIVCLVFAGLFSLFSFRLIYLQIVMHGPYSALAIENHSDRQTIFAERGAIFDSRNEILAQNVPNETVVADASVITDCDGVATQLAKALDLDRDEVLEKLQTANPYIVMKRSVPLEVTAALKENLTAIKQNRFVIFERSSTRIYPNGPMLCHVLGFTDFDRKGIQGVEASMEQYLHGEDGFRLIERNRSGKELPNYRGSERPAQDGYQVHLTIDSSLQNIVENEIDAAMKEYTPLKATIILMRPDTGEILAMANRPNFDLNKRNEAKPEQMKNRAIIDMMEPGSTFKIVTAAAALNEGKVQPDTIINCENGVWNYAGEPLHDHGSGYGELSVQDILIHSSNIGAAKLALSIGDQKFDQYIHRFGFGRVTGIELPGEIGGMLEPARKWRPIAITRIAMGHTIGVTPLQMTRAMAAIANGGKLVTPRIVKSITDAKGKTVASSSPEFEQILSPATAAQIGNALRGVVSDRGTAKGAAVEGYTIAGKTGTAQKLVGGRYDPNKTVVSFLGYLPAEHPEFVGLVVLDDPHTKTREENYGGKVSGPIFASIAAKAAGYLNLPPNEMPPEDIKRAVAVQTSLTSPTRH